MTNAPYHGDHHVAIAEAHGLAVVGGTLAYEGTLQSVRTAADEYRRSSEYLVGSEVVANRVVSIEVTSRNGLFRTVLRSRASDWPAYLPAIDPSSPTSPRTVGEIRAWYTAEVHKIPALDKLWVANGIPLEERAHRAHDVRHTARVAARDQMTLTGVTQLELRDYDTHGDVDGPSFEALVEKYRARGMTRAQALEALIAASSRTSDEYNQRAGLEAAKQ